MLSTSPCASKVERRPLANLSSTIRDGTIEVMAAKFVGKELGPHILNVLLRTTLNITLMLLVRITGKGEPVVLKTELCNPATQKLNQVKSCPPLLRQSLTGAKYAFGCIQQFATLSSKIVIFYLHIIAHSNLVNDTLYP